MVVSQTVRTGAEPGRGLCGVRGLLWDQQSTRDAPVTALGARGVELPSASGRDFRAAAIHDRFRSDHVIDLVFRITEIRENLDAVGA